jgi:hypothetical protein
MIRILIDIKYIFRMDKMQQSHWHLFGCVVKFQQLYYIITKKG